MDGFHFKRRGMLKLALAGVVFPRCGNASQASISPNSIAGFTKLRKPVRDLITDALAMTRQGLTYKFGSADPANGGMDCSGAIYYLLRKQGLDTVPRVSYQIYNWAVKTKAAKGKGANSLSDPSLKDIEPGDLLFWSGTYRPKTPRNPPITHVMLYLGREAVGGRQVVMGASEGRRYAGRKQAGVSVFDFKVPKASSKAKFWGYCPVPGL